MDRKTISNLPGEELVKMNGKTIGCVYPCALGWGYYIEACDNGAEGDETKEGAITTLIEEFLEWLEDAQYDLQQLQKRIKNIVLDKK